MIRHLAAACLVVLLAVQFASAQPPAVGTTYPHAVAPGTSTNITLYGNNLAGVTDVWTNFGGQIELAPDIEGNGTHNDHVVYRVTLPADTSLQVGAIRVATPAGVSNLRLLLIDDLPSVGDNGDNKTLETAQELTLPVAVDGTCEAESFDFYKFNALAGQRISAEVFARRLGYPLDPVIRLLDAQGRELAYSDDEAGTSADSRFVHQFDEDGTYYIEIRDIRYQGGGGHRYRLRIGDFPLVNTALPLAARRGATSRLQVAGPAVDRTSSLDVTLPAEVPGGLLPVTFRNQDGQGGAFVYVTASGTREQIEFEPNDTPEQASPISLPGAVSGRFAKDKDRDYYQFDVAEGQRYLFIGHTRRIGSPTDLYMRLFKADGTQLAEVDDTGAEEGILNHTFAEAGTYRLMVEDLHRRGGSEHAYRIEMVPFQPGFQLVLDADRHNPPRGGVFVAKVTARRLGYDGPITLALENAEGFALANNVIPEKQNEIEIRVTAPANLEPGHWRHVAVVGTARIDETDFRARAGTLDVLKGQNSGLPFPPQSLDGLVAVGIGPLFPDFFKLAAAENTVRLPQLIGTATLTVKAEKLNGFNDAIALRVEGLPGDFAVEAAPIEKDKGEAQIKLTAAGALAEGEYRFRVVGDATFQNQPKSATVDELVLLVTPPLAVSVEFAGPVTAGEQVTAKIRVTRYGEEHAPIVVKFENLPLGLTAPSDITISAEVSEIEVELGAAPSSMIGEANNVVVTAHTQVQGREIRAQSPPATLQVDMPQ